MREPVIRTYQTRTGPMLALASDQYITQALALYGEYAPDEGRMLRQMIRPGMTVVEIGANMGSHSVDMARACAPGPFYAFEPQQLLFQILCGNLVLNNVTNAIAYPDACGAAEGEAIVPQVCYGEAGNFGGISLRSKGIGRKVRVRPLDALDLPACDVIKIDVEGFEPAVLRGAAETIRRCRPVLYVENDRVEQQQEVISLIAALGYSLYWHVPPLFSPLNYRANPDNIWPGVVSVNMLCLPTETTLVVAGATPIDPSNWTCPVSLNV
jgi:FkbM family methyltransferase